MRIFSDTHVGFFYEEFEDTKGVIMSTFLYQFCSFCL